MGEQEYFRNALSDFTYEAASGGAIRHLADLGYTVKQICGKLTYPTPCERVRKTVWQHLCDTGTILTEEPGNGARSGKAACSVRYDRFGRASFCMERQAEGRVTDDVQPLRERRYSAEACGELAAYLDRACGACGEKKAYLSCDFGLSDRRRDGTFEAQMRALNARQREYIEGLPWEDRICYHRMDGRMREIVTRLYAQGLYQGCCYFLTQREKVLLG